MTRAGVLAIGALVVVGGLTQSAPRWCPLPLRVPIPSTAVPAGVERPPAPPAASDAEALAARAPRGDDSARTSSSRRPRAVPSRRP